MSIAHHHNEWLSLVEVSGPFLSLPVLLKAFPQGLAVPHEPELTRTFRLAYEEWLDSQAGARPDSAIHTQWLRWVLQNVLGYQPDMLLRDQAIGAELWATMAEQGETLRPDYVLRHPDQPKARLLIQLYPASQKLEKPLGGVSWIASPAERMMQLLRRTDCRLGLVTNGEHWMLVHAPQNRDDSVGYISWFSTTWLEEPLTLRAFRSLLQPYRFFGVEEKQTLENMFVESAASQQEVTDQLGYQVRRAVETLVQAFDRIDKDRNRELLKGISEQQLYESALAVMMRLVFLMSAEERGMLPLGENALYTEYYAVSSLGAQLRAIADHHSEQILETRADAWSRLLATFRMVFGGVTNADLPLLAYGGDLFDPDRYPFLEGRAPGTNWQTQSDPQYQPQPLPISNRIVLHVLDALQWLEVRVEGSGNERRKLSFRALDIEQIGHVYEGLLDHTARRATGPVVSLRGNKYNEPEIGLDELESHRAKGQQALLEFLREETGRSENALKKDLTFKPDLLQLGQLRAACDNDEALLQRVLPWAGLVRLDSFENFVVITPGSLYVTQGSDRRSTGTHYTPRSLTEPIVRHTLDALVYSGPAEGLAEDKWQLKSAAHLLNLKVCDMAMGSGAFLVQVCRYLSEKLVMAWEKYPAAQPGDEPLPPDRDERLALARRMVAERCLYGVDKNPMAVEMAKLSLWLVTLDKNQPFSFLNHALRGGDSLLGVTRQQLVARSMDGETKPNLWQYNRLMERTIGDALAARSRIRSLPVNADVRINQMKARLQHEAEEMTSLLRLGGDIVVAMALEQDKTRRGLLDTTLELPYTVLVKAYEESRAHPLTPQAKAALDADRAELQAKVDALLTPRDRRPFHWPVEFPEVFYPEAQTAYRHFDPANLPPAQEPGFQALISNPPFQGGQKITGALGTDYRDYLVEYLAGGKRGSADLCAYFFLRANDLTQPDGQAGLLATNTIAQGDSREVGLEQLVAKGWSIPRAIPSRKWPGTASLEVAHIWLRQGEWRNQFVLEDSEVAGITPFLTTPGTTEGKPYQLAINSNKSFIGSYVLGMGFVLEPEEAQALIAKDPRNKDVLFAYLNGEDLNSRPDQSPSRWIINFFDWPLEKAQSYSDVFKIIEEKVKPERQRKNDNGEYALRKPLPEKWWIYGEKRPALYSTIAGMERVLVRAQVSRTHAPVFVSTNQVISMMCVALVFDDYCYYSLIQSNLHELWVNEYSSSLKKDQRYTPSDCFETFPLPLEENMEGLEAIGEEYYTHRQAVMTARQQGLTKTYNRFHHPAENAAEIVRLRELHREMDIAVAAAYGWRDLDLGHDFHDTKQGLRYTISEQARREVLGRLLKLNHQRYAAEVAEGLHDKGRKARKKAALKPAKASPPQGSPDPTAPPGSAPTPGGSISQGKLFEVEETGSLWEWAEQQGDD